MPEDGIIAAEAAIIPRLLRGEQSEPTHAQKYASGRSHTMAGSGHGIIAAEAAIIPRLYMQVYLEECL